MSLVLQSLISNGPLLTDGAWGTQMQARGLPIGGCPDLWNLDHPDLVQEVAAAYVKAGSRAILTNTFGANRFTLSRHGMADRVDVVNQRGAEIGKSAAGGVVKVFGSIGPTGKLLSIGEVPPEAVHAAFLEQARGLAAGGVDALVVETMSDIDEAVLAVTAAKETGLPVVACMVYGFGKSGDRTINGATPELAVEKLSAAGADVIGSNCGIGADSMRPLVERLRAATDLPLWIKPNAGLPELIDGKATYRTTPAEFVAAALSLVAAGANFIGGCCGTSPEFIAALSAALK